MKWLSDLFRSGNEPTPAQIGKAVRQVTQPHGDPAARMGAADRLKTWGTPEAIAGLLRRFTIQTPSGAVDLQECQEVEAMLVELGRPAVEPILRFLEREEQVAYPARALEKILPVGEFVERILGVLERLEAGFGSHSDQRAGLIRALEEVQDPRIAPGVRRFLNDPDDDVAIAAIHNLVRAGDPACVADLAEVLARTADRPRVRLDVAERLAQAGWPTGEHRKTVEAALPRGFSLDRQGRVLATG